MATILLLEDEETLRYTITTALERAGFAVAGTDSTDTAREMFASEPISAVVTDVNLNGSDDGLAFAKWLRSESFDGPIVIMTGYGSIKHAVEAMKSGVDDYLQKPVSLEELVLQVKRLLEAGQLKRRVRLYERLDSVHAHNRQILGSSTPWQQTLALADRLAQVPIPDEPSGQSAQGLPSILLLGETGTGKGMLARYIHDQACEAIGSKGDALPFVHVNCTALPPSLIESELFGHEKGAFTDARSAREGLFEMAHNGTIFLDEIGDMPLELQAKILTVVEEGRFRRVGGTKERHIRARLITATNVHLEDKVQQGAFRRDLFYRLNTFTINIPALRDRNGDALEIAKAMLRQLGQVNRRPMLYFTQEAQQAISEYAWPGNVRELINMLQRAVVLAESDAIRAKELGLEPPASSQPMLADEPTHHNGMGSSPGSGELIFDFDRGHLTAASVEEELIKQALLYTRGNVSKAARLLNMQRSSLRYRIERFELAPFIQELAKQ